jgi:hypothetical protein
MMETLLNLKQTIFLRMTQNGYIIFDISILTAALAQRPASVK